MRKVFTIYLIALMLCVNIGFNNVKADDEPNENENQVTTYDEPNADFNLYVYDEDEPSHSGYASSNSGATVGDIVIEIPTELYNNFNVVFNGIKINSNNGKEYDNWIQNPNKKSDNDSNEENYFSFITSGSGENQKCYIVYSSDSQKKI